jgi:hypothetical protein
MTSWECYENKWFYMKYIDYIVRIGEKIKLLFLNQFLKESRNIIIWKFYEWATILISAFNAENFMKIR